MNKLKEGRDEAILDPGIVIVDTHHHLFDRPSLRYMLEDYLEDVHAGHAIVASVYVETQAMARPDGPEWLRPVGEVEFANGVAAMSASGLYGPCLVAAAIVGHADLSVGDDVARTLDRQILAAPDRLRGIRQIAMAHPDPKTLSFLASRPHPDLLKAPQLGRGLQHLERRGLLFEATVLHHQLHELANIADQHPDLTVVLDHLGLALAMNTDEAGRLRVFNEWRDALQALARRPNVLCKIGGLGTAYWGFGFNTRTDSISCHELAAAWRPYVEVAIEAFGANRCMMESDFPADARSCGFVPLWNALKHIVRNCSPADKDMLFHGTALKAYQINLA